jgi:hypothetical protein
LPEARGIEEIFAKGQEDSFNQEGKAKTKYCK